MQNIKTIGSDKYKQLSDIDHVILRSEMYTGSRRKTEVATYLLYPDRKIYNEVIETSPATITLGNEILNNSYDEYRRCMNENRAHKVSRIDATVNLAERSLLVTDDGGIPVAKHEESGLLLPTLLFGRLRSGSNYTDERGDMSGLNGIGAVLVNIFSEVFRVTTADGEYKFDQTWRDNLSIEEDPIVVPSKERFSAFYAKFSQDEKTQIDIEMYNETWARMIEMRCCELAAMGADPKHPLLVTWKTILPNGEEWKNEFCFKDFKDYLQLWPQSSDMIYDEQHRFKIALCPSTGSQESVALVNSIRCDWGTHIDTFIDACVWHIRNHIQRRFKIDVRPAKIKSYIKTISTWRIDAPTFRGQTKDWLVTAPQEFGFPAIPTELFIKQLLRSKIVQQIVDELHSKIMEQRKQELGKQQQLLEKQMKRNILPTKLTDASNAGKPGCTLFIVEGDSAAGGFKKARNAKHQGIFAMFGKSCGNMLYADEFKVLANKAWSGLHQAIGLSFTKNMKLRYDKIVLATDADYDGSCIAGLMLVYFNKFHPELFDQGKIFRLQTPIMVATKGNDIRRFYTMHDYEAEAKQLQKQNFQIEQMKGLASLDDKEYALIMQEPRLIQVVRDDWADESIEAWFGRDPQKRKELMGMPTEAFDIDDYFSDDDDNASGFAEDEIVEYEQ